MRQSIERRLEQLEAVRDKVSRHWVQFCYSDGEDPEPHRSKAEADYRAAHQLPDSVKLNYIARHIVSVEWIDPSRAKDRVTA